MTALHHAATEGHVECLTELINAGANIEAVEEKVKQDLLYIFIFLLCISFTTDVHIHNTMSSIFTFNFVRSVSSFFLLSIELPAIL